MDRRFDLHTNGIHLECKRPKSWWLGTKRSGIPTGHIDDDNCPLAGTVESLHSHDFDGPCPVCDE